MRKSLLICLLFVAALTARAEQVIISEIMYHPVETTPDATKPEYIEVWNVSTTPRDMAKWRFTGGIAFEFPDFSAGSAQASFLKALERIIISSADEATTRANYTIPAGVRVFGPWVGSLANEGEQITLADKNGVRVSTVDYRDGGRWPRAADGTGHSLVIKNENRAVDDFRNWRASSFVGGTPGAGDTAPAPQSLRLSEAHFSGNNAIDWVEVQNIAGVGVSADGLFVASEPTLANKVALTGTVAANGFASYDVQFPGAANGDVTLYLADATNNILATVELERRVGRDSMQAIYPVVPVTLPRWQHVSIEPEWYADPTATRDAANNPTINGAVVINEIMCDPPSEHPDGEYIELHNRGTDAVSLAGWKLRGGVDYDFPANAAIPPGGYVVVSGASAYIRDVYAGITVYGDWSGNLANKGELIRLVDNFGNLADEVDYLLGGDWPDVAAGAGSSLELLHPAMDNGRASAWRDSDESNKSAFQSYAITETFRQSRVMGAATDYKELHIHHANDGHVILRNVAVKLNNAGSNLLTNANVMSTNGSSATGWLAQGTHGKSFIDPSGDFHLIADGHGDVRPNRAEIDATAMVANSSYTISFDARWVSGTPRMVVQTWDRSIGKAVRLPVPNNLGTPGAANSRLAASPLPQVDSVLHSPAVPKPTDPVVVTARVASATPLSAVEVLHRADSITATNAWVAAPMFDDGTNGDLIPNDGTYTATITAHQTNNRIVQFYVRATAPGGVAELPKNGALRPGMWMVDSRNIPATLRRQRIVISAYDRDALNTGSGGAARFQFKYPRLSNHYFPAVFIHNETDVYYMAEIHKSGSPWTRSDANTLDRAKWKLPDDRIFRERQKTTWDNDATGGNRHHNRIIRYHMYLCGFAGSNQEEFAHTMVNADGVIIRNDTEPTDTDLLNRAFDNGNEGQLMQVEDEWWFDDAWNRQNRDADWSYKGTHEPTRYHTEYNLRSREWEYDYSALTEMFRRVTTAPEDELNRMLNRDQVMLVAAVRGYAGDWDSQTLNRGKNAYLYRKPNDSRWMYLHWDSDLAFQNSGEVVVGGFTGWGAYANKPYHRRVLNYYLTLLVKNFTRGSARMTAWFDAEEAASSAYTIDRAFYNNWFNSREARIIQEINGAFGGGRGSSYTAPFAVSTATGGTTSASTVDIAGTAPSTAFQIVVDGHPEAIFRWNNQTEWTLTGLILKSGLNSFTVRSVDGAGTSLGTATFTIEKTDNAPPAMILAADPASWNVALGEDLLLDASASVDPDGVPLTFAWAVEPTSGVTLSHPTASSARALFSRPGLYSVTVTGTDTNAAAVPLTREVLVYNSADFSSMGSKELDPIWQALNIEERDNYSPSAWYSTQDEPGTLFVQVLDDSAKPPTFGSPTHPLITRALPATSDFVLQTDLKLENRQTGTFFTGLVVDTMESGAPVRYLFGLESLATATAFTVKRSTGGSFTNVASQTIPSGATIVRVVRAGNELRFQRQVNDVWQAPVAAQALPEGTTAAQGGIFVATTTAENVRVGFDYIVLADTSNATPVLSALRLTELMYGPARPSAEETLALPGVSAGDFEFIEVANVGTTPLELGGARFDTGITFVFPPGFVLGPGERTVIVAEETAFRLRYGNGVTIAGEFAGSLDNSGEEVRLLDGNGVEALRFTYSPLWYPPTDGTGYSLVNRNPNGSDSYSVPGSWAISGSSGGSPGSAESGFSQTFEGWRHDHFTAAEQVDPLIGATTANPDGDNGDNLAEYAFAKNPRLSGEPVTTELSTVIVDGVEYVAIRFDRPKQALDLTYGIEITTDLLNWAPSGFLAGVPEDLANGIERVTFAVTGLTQAHTTYHIRPTALHATGARPGDALPFTTPNTHPLASDKTLHAPIEGVPTVVYSTSDTSDADGDARTITVLQYSGAGSATSDGTSITFTNAGFTGAETVQVGVSDGYGGSGVATVTLRNEAPVGNADGFAVGTGGALLTVLANDSDPDGDGLSILSVSAGAGGTVTTDGTTISYTPGPGFTGSEEISYVVADQRGGETSATATVVADFSVTRTVAGTNEQVPGMNGASWGVFGVPSIFAEGTQAGWLGSIKLGNAGLNGIFSGEIGAPQLRLRSDEPARDASGAILPQTRFKSFRQPVFGNDSFAFLAKITGGGINAGNDSGVWLGTETGLRAVAREGESAPGTSGARFKAFTSVAMLGTENLFFTAKLQPQGGLVTPANDTGLWVGTALALREGQTIDTGNGSRTVKSFAVLSSVKGSAGHGRYDPAEGCIDALITFTDGGSAIATIRADASVTFAASTGQTDDQGRTPVQFGIPSSPGGGQMPVAITTFAGGAFSKTNNMAVFDFAEKRIVAQKGTLAVGSNSVFEKFQDPVAGLGLDGARISAFLATLQGASAAENTGLWADMAGATPSLNLIAREGSAAPDAAGTKFKAFQSISILEGRGPMFTAKLSSAGSRVTGANDQGLWVTDSTGTLRMVLREGDSINGKILRTFRLLESVPGSPGQRRSWSNGDPAATIIYLGYFTDGSSAILTRTIP